jgi:hypothetical protein
MHRALRITGATALLALAACAHEGAAPTTPPDDAGLLAAAAVDLSVGAAAGQASLPGLTMEPASTYDGALRGSDQCTYVPDVGRVVCAPVTRNGLTFTRSIAFHDAAGQPQPRRDSTTASVNTQVGVKGTTTTDRGTLAVDRSSSLTVSGLGRDATTHTLNGSESGTTTHAFTTKDGNATATETFTAATKDVVVPVPKTRGSWPLSGTTTRASTLAITRGTMTRSMTMSEQVTFTGTSVVNVTLTRDGVTRTCTRDLATHMGTCR